MSAPAVDPLAWTRADFPLLQRQLDNHPITHLDSASTSPKPQCVIDAVTRCYRDMTANVHRGVHGLSEEATDAFERARQEIASFIHASPSEIVFTRNTTESINLVAHGLRLQPEDEVVLTAIEHHSNFMPWMSGRWTATSWRSQATSCSVLQAWACCTANATGWRHWASIKSEAAW